MATRCRSTLFSKPRVFHADAELRWWNAPVAGKHRAALLSEQPTPPDWKTESLADLENLPQTFLLWGQAADASCGLAPNWTRLTTARIGKLDVPVASGKQVHLNAVEYLAESKFNGNLAVADEPPDRADGV